MEAPTALHALVDEIITHPLYNHVALARSHGLLVYAKDQGLVGFLYSDATCALSYKTEISVFTKMILYKVLNIRYRDRIGWGFFISGIGYW